MSAAVPVPPELLTLAQSALHSRPTNAWRAGTLPRRVGKFNLLEELGSGSFGTVYRAVDTELEREVAVKVLRAGRLASAEDVDRFLREARSAAQLKHPGIVSLYEAGRDADGVCYLVEELVRGSTLADRLKDGPFDAARRGSTGRGSRRRAGGRPPAGHRSSRRQAVEHHPRCRGPAARDGLRPRQARHRRRDRDARRRRAGHAGLHVARNRHGASRTRSMPAATSTASASSSTNC